jgi:hypothetical protein
MVMQTSAPGATPEQTRPRATLAPFLPRIIRLRDAPSYLGMDKNRFCREVRPLLSAIPIGTQGVAFDRLDLDTWADGSQWSLKPLYNAASASNRPASATFLR